MTSREETSTEHESEADLAVLDMALGDLVLFAEHYAGGARVVLDALESRQLDGLISSVQTHLELVWSERVEPGSVRRWLIEELDAHRASLEQALGTQDEGDWG